MKTSALASRIVLSGMGLIAAIWLSNVAAEEADEAAVEEVEEEAAVEEEAEASRPVSVAVGNMEIIEAPFTMKGFSVVNPTIVRAGKMDGRRVQLQGLKAGATDLKFTSHDNVSIIYSVTVVENITSVPDASPMQPDTKYWKQLAAFAYSSYLEYGNGVVRIKEKPSQPFSPANLDKHFQYIPFDPENEEIPQDAVKMIKKYNPKKELVLMNTDAKGQTVCLQLTAKKLGITPLEAYRALHGKFVPGNIYKLYKPIDDIQTGYYVYEREEKGMLIFCLVRMDDEGDAFRTDKTIRVRLDFKDFFVGTEMKVSVE